MSEKSKRKSQIKAVNKFIKGHYDRININVPVGKKKEYLRFAQEHGFEHLTPFIVHCIEQFIKLSENSDNSIAPDGEQ